jgi:trans-2-enoyl-CoA reductase
MLSRSSLRAATQGTRNAALTRSAAFPAIKAQCANPSISALPSGRRHVSMYGYTQAKALMYSKYGEPKDVLRYFLP